MPHDKLRIAILTNFYKPTISGVVTSISLFRQGLIDQGHDVHIFAPEVEDFEDQEPYIFRIPALIDLNKTYDISLALPLRRPMRPTIRGIKPHLIHSQHPVMVGDLAVMYAEEMGLPLVFTYHTRYDKFASQNVPLISDWAEQVARDIVRDYLERCTWVIAPTLGIKAMIYDDYGIDVPVTVLPTPIDLSQYNRLNPDSVRRRYQLEDKKVLLYLGRIAQEKCLDLLLRSLAIILPQCPQAVLMLVGKGIATDALEELARSLNIESHVIFTGVVAHEQVPDYMAAADVFVFPSEFETQGLVLIEAMAAGTPVVAVHGLGSDDILAGGQGGILVENDEQQFAQAVLALLSDSARLIEMGQAAHAAAQVYSISSATQQLLSVYDQALTRGPRPARHSIFSLS